MPRAGRQRTPEEQYRLVIKSFPNFGGVIAVDGGKWEARRRTTGAAGKRRWEPIGTFESLGEAFAAYKIAKTQLMRGERDTAGRIERLLAAAARFPVQFRVERSLMGSSMDTTLSNWQRAMD